MLINSDQSASAVLAKSVFPVPGWPYSRRCRKGVPFSYTYKYIQTHI